jgi:hypothetical protein
MTRLRAVAGTIPVLFAYDAAIGSIATSVAREASPRTHEPGSPTRWAPVLTPFRGTAHKGAFCSLSAPRAVIRRNRALMEEVICQLAPRTTPRRTSRSPGGTASSTSPDGCTRSSTTSVGSAVRSTSSRWSLGGLRRAAGRASASSPRPPLRRSTPSHSSKPSSPAREVRGALGHARAGGPDSPERDPNPPTATSPQSSPPPASPSP